MPLRDTSDDTVELRHDPAMLLGNGRKSNLADDRFSQGVPTDEELQTLRRIPDSIPWSVYTVAFIELCERFSYYGAAVVFTNFIQQPLPDGSATGADRFHGQPGALAMGQRGSTGITTFNSFWVYCTPILGAYVADTYLGRYNTICVSLAIAIVGHVLLTVSAAPTVLSNQGGSFACFLIGVIVMGVGTGGLKPNISTLIVEQLPRIRMQVVTNKKGERVIADPAVTTSRVFHYFYFFINIGALVGQVGMTFSEKYIGFWLAYLLPTALLVLCPIVLYVCRNRYVRNPPAGSVSSKAIKLFVLANKGCWSSNLIATHRRLHNGTFWESVKPSRFTDANRPKWMTFDDAWVDEVGRGFAACSVFLWYPLYWLAYTQLNSNLTSQAAVMELHGLPNDVISNLDPLALVIMIPIFDLVVYPGLRRLGIKFTPIKKITLGFFTCSAAMVWAAVVQVYIYRDSVCGYRASDPNCPPVNINVWAQTGSYILVAFSEIFASITSLEYAFSKAPKNMRSLVMAFALFMSALSSAIGEAFVSLSADSLLVWNYGTIAVLAAIGGICFWYCHRDLDRDEDKLNLLPTGLLTTSTKVTKIEEG